LLGFADIELGVLQRGVELLAANLVGHRPHDVTGWVTFRENTLERTKRRRPERATGAA